MEYKSLEIWCSSAFDVGMHANTNAYGGWRLVTVIPPCPPDPTLQQPSFQSAHFLSGPYTFVFEKLK